MNQIPSTIVLLNASLTSSLSNAFAEVCEQKLREGEKAAVAGKSPGKDLRHLDLVLKGMSLCRPSWRCLLTALQSQRLSLPHLFAAQPSRVHTQPDATVLSTYSLTDPVTTLWVLSPKPSAPQCHLSHVSLSC